MSRTRIPQFAMCLAVGLGALGLSAAARADGDPPTRVARLSYMSGTVSFDPAGSEDWVAATPNRPLMTGDSLWDDQDGRAELDLGRVAFRGDHSTSITLTNVDDKTAQVELAQGNLAIDVRRMDPDDIVEVDTPNLAFQVTTPGSYRVNVAADGSTTLVVVRNGQANVVGQSNAYTINAHEAYSFSGTDLGGSTYYDVPAPDDFDRFVASRESRLTRSASLRYVPPEMIGYEDLDDHGTWQDSPEYGHVWVPSGVAVDWAPYHDGHWAWIDPFGWTWVDAAPWGFAPFHYGRWAHIGPVWGWVPGPVAVAPVYAPALVAFVGGPPGVSVGLSIGGGVGVGIGWFPLGPREVYQPGYAVSPAYVQHINVSNTNVTNTYVTNVVNNRTVNNVTYVNQSVPGAVTAVPQNAFAEGRPVAQAAVPLSREQLAHASVVPVAAVAPTARSFAPGAAARAVPPAAAQQRPVIARTPPPPAPLPVATRVSALSQTQGRPLAPQAVEAIRAKTPAAALARPAPHVVSAAPAPQARPAASSTAPAAPRPTPKVPEATKAQSEVARPSAPHPPTTAAHVVTPPRPAASLPQESRPVAPRPEQHESEPRPEQHEVVPHPSAPHPEAKPASHPPAKEGKEEKRE